MKQPILTTSKQLQQLCGELRNCEAIGFDTEFVSEHTYRPQLCLVQIATAEHLVAIDAIAIRDLTPLWELLTDADHQTIVHAGREELGFALDATGKGFANLLDVQIAAGLAGHEYPAGYGTLTQKILGHASPKGETRTDWRKRPLSKHQLTYALNDVKHLLAIRDVLLKRLEIQGRLDWLSQEMATFEDDIRLWRQGERFQNVSGSGSLHGITLAVLRELWLWREEQARQRDIPAKKVLRDDLLVELSKRQVTDPKQICALRGMERTSIRDAAKELAECVRRGLEVPAETYPKQRRHSPPSQVTMLGQFLASALSSICRDAEVAPNLVGNPTDVRDLVSYRLAKNSKRSKQEAQPPRLARGWRAELVGDALADLLAGKTTIRIADPHAQQPLAFEPYQELASRQP